MSNEAPTIPDAPPYTATGGAAAPGESPSLAALMKGILDDAMALMRQQFAMFKAELKSDLNAVMGGAILLAAGIAPLLLGLLMLCFTLVHLIHWATTPAEHADPASIPLWGCYAIVSGLFLIIGGGLLGAGIIRLKSVNPLPDESARALEENIKWLTTPK